MSLTSLPHMPPVQGGQMPPPKYANAYSSSGFDMLGVLVSRSSEKKVWQN